MSYYPASPYDGYPQSYHQPYPQHYQQHVYKLRQPPPTPPRPQTEKIINRNIFAASIIGFMLGWKLYYWVDAYNTTTQFLEVWDAV